MPIILDPKTDPKRDSVPQESKRTGAKITPGLGIQMAGCTRLELATSDVTEGSSFDIAL